MFNTQELQILANVVNASSIKGADAIIIANLLNKIDGLLKANPVPVEPVAEQN